MPMCYRHARMSDRLVSLGRTEPREAPRPPAADALKVYVETYGCQMNVADSDLIGSVLAEAGYATTARADQADIIVINTCAVREKAVRRSSARSSASARTPCSRSSAAWPSTSQRGSPIAHPWST